MYTLILSYYIFMSFRKSVIILLYKCLLSILAAKVSFDGGVKREVFPRVPGVRIICGAVTEQIPPCSIFYSSLQSSIPYQWHYFVGLRIYYGKLSPQITGYAAIMLFLRQGSRDWSDHRREATARNIPCPLIEIVGHTCHHLLPMPLLTLLPH